MGRGCSRQRKQPLCRKAWGGGCGGGQGQGRTAHGGDLQQSSLSEAVCTGGGPGRCGEACSSNLRLLPPGLAPCLSISRLLLQSERTWDLGASALPPVGISVQDENRGGRDLDTLACLKGEQPGLFTDHSSPIRMGPCCKDIPALPGPA